MRKPIRATASSFIEPDSATEAARISAARSRGKTAHAGQPFDRRHLTTRSPATLVAMTRYRVFSLARITGHTAWWIFVVATLFAGGITWTGVSRYGNYKATSFTKEYGWTAYTGLTDAPVGIANFVGSSYDPWSDPELWSAIVFGVVLVAAVVEAISAREVLPGIVTVAAPCVAFGLLLLATPGVLDGIQLGTTTTIGVVLVAVAVREVWARRLAPQPS